MAYNSISIKPYIKSHLELQREMTLIKLAPSPYFFVLSTRGDQKVRGKVLLYHIAFMDCNENSQIETTIHSKLTEIKI